MAKQSGCRIFDGSFPPRYTKEDRASMLRMGDTYRVVNGESALGAITDYTLNPLCLGRTGQNPLPEDSWVSPV